jgi:hypothetical protein
LTPKFHKKLEGDIRNEEKRQKKERKRVRQFLFLLNFSKEKLQG